MVRLQRMATKYPGLFLAACLKAVMGVISGNLLLLKERVTSVGVARFCFSGFLFLSASALYAVEPSASTPLKQVTQNSLQQLNASTSTKPKQPTSNASSKDSDSSQAVIANNIEKNSVENKPVFADKSLAAIQSIAQTGAVRLALFNLAAQQPTFKDAPNRWLSWERERISLLNISGQNAVLVERLNNLPDGVNLSFEYWAKTQQASAYLKLQAYSKARQTLSVIIWRQRNIDFEFNNKWLPHWRRLIIYSYLDEGRIKDAHIAITRFRQDYDQGDFSDIILYARVLLMNNLVDEALSLLSKYTDNPEAGMLHLLAQLRKGVRSPRIVLQAGLRQMQGDWVKPELKTYLWAIVAEAAKRSEDRLAGIKAMEFIFSDVAKRNLPKGLFHLSIDDLWNAYIENARYIGNKAQYLMGDDPVWLKAAEAFDVTQVVNARSLYAFLILRGQDKEIKRQATKLFLKSLMANTSGKELVNQLFLNSNQFKTKQSTPVVIRHFLVDYALANANIRLASELMASIKTSPQGADKFMWALRRARVLVMGGKATQSANALVDILSEQKNIAVEDIDKLMQVVFDLQTVKADEQAYRVLKKILLHTNDLKRKREIYYWMADSRKAQKKYADAANLYLKSAMLPNSDEFNTSAEHNLDSALAPNLDSSLDPWGQTARYQAASNLAKAGLISDARALYTTLLKATQDEGRLKVLKHELQQLWLLENQITE